MSPSFKRERGCPPQSFYRRGSGLALAGCLGGLPFRTQTLGSPRASVPGCLFLAQPVFQRRVKPTAELHRVRAAMCPHGGSHHAWGFLLTVTGEVGRQMLRDGRATGESHPQPPLCCPQGWCPALSAQKPEPTVLGSRSVQPPEAPWGTWWSFCPRGLSIPVQT